MGEAEGHREPELVTVGVEEAVGGRVVPMGVKEMVAEGSGVEERLVLGERDVDTVTEGVRLTLGEREGDTDTDTERLTLRVSEGVTDTEAERLPLEV